MEFADFSPITTKTRTITWDAYLGIFDVIRIVMTKFLKKGVSMMFPRELAPFTGFTEDEVKEKWIDRA